VEGVDIEGNGDGRAPPPTAGWVENTIITERRQKVAIFSTFSLFCELHEYDHREDRPRERDGGSQVVNLALYSRKGVEGFCYSCWKLL
jgi:hypothetical protein